MIVGVSYGTEPEKVQEILIEVARTHPDVMSNPEPVTLFAGFGESYLDFELRCWTAESFHRVRSELAIAINRSLTKAGIEISSRNGICTCAAMKQRTLNEKIGYFVSHPARF